MPEMSNTNYNITKELDCGERIMFVWCVDCTKYHTSDCPEYAVSSIYRICKDFKQKDEVCYLKI